MAFFFIEPWVIRRLYYKIENLFGSPAKLAPDGKRAEVHLPPQGEAVSVEMALNSRCNSDYDENPNKFHWGMFDRTRKLPQTQIEEVVSLARIPRFTNGKVEFESDFKETSLPSGHTSTAFTAATILSNRIDNMYASVALYSLASLTALQRIYVDRHWFSDTILGAALGTAIGLKVVKLHEENASPKEDFQYNFYPQLQSGNIGIGLALQF